MSIKNIILKSILILFQFIGLNATAQNSNITISTSPTSGGDWVTTTIGSDITYTFTPNSNSAILNNADIVNRLYGATGYTIGNVTINTANPSGTESGSITIASEIRTINRSTTRYTLQIIAAGDMLINGSFEMSASNSPLTANCNNLILTAGGNISLIGRINLIPESAYRDNITLYSSSGDITINATGFVKVANTIKADGNYNSGYQGAYEYSHGGNISITGLGGVSISSDITSFPYGGSSGTITINSGNTTHTTNGVNNGQTAGVFYCSSFYKKGAGVFAVKSANTILYGTNINQGTLKIITLNTIPVANALRIDAEGTLDMNGKNFTSASLLGAGSIVSNVAGDLTFTTGSDNSSTSFSGAFNETAAVLNIVKVGTGKLILAGSSNYTGTTLVNAGTLNIQNDGALGTSSMLTLNEVNTQLELESTSDPINIESTPIKITGSPTNYPAIYSTLKNVGGNNTYTSDIILSGNSTISIDAGSFVVNSITGTTNNLQFTGNGGTIYTNGTINIGTSNLQKTGSSTLVLQKENFYSGFTSINGGVVKIENEKVFGATSKVNIYNTGSLELEDGFTITGLPLHIAASGLNNSGGLRNISGTNIWAGPITFTNLGRINSDDGVLILPNTINAIVSTNIINFGGNGIISVDGIIGSGFVSRDGLGILQLNEANTYSGETTFTNGTIQLNAENSIANSSLVFNGGILKTTGSNQSFRYLTIKENSIIDLANINHALSFTGEGSFALKRLLIKNWQGAYNGTAGTMGIIKIGNVEATTKEFLDQIRFIDPNNKQYNSKQLSTGEIVPNQDIKRFPTRNSNINISSAPTFGGKWTSASVGSVITYTFMPFTDNANLCMYDINNRITGNGFTVGNVTIKTTNTTGIKNITTNGEYTFNSTKFINSNGALKSNGENGLTNNGSIVGASVGTQLGSVFINDILYGVNYKPISYTFKIEAGGSIVSNSKLNLGCGNTDLNYIGNHLDFSAGLNINIANAISTQGSNTETWGSVRSNGGDITLTATENIKISAAGTIQSYGGRNTLTGIGASYTTSNGGTIRITAGKGLTCNGTIDASSGYLNKGVNGYIYLKNENTIITTGGGVNDGMANGIITGGNFVKDGFGTIALGRLNTYNGVTYLNEGTLQLGVNNSLPVTTELDLSGGIFIMGGFSQTVAYLNLLYDATITFSNSNLNTLTANSVKVDYYSMGKVLTIYGWEGTYAAPGSAGNFGKLIFNGTPQSAAKLGQIKFYNVADGTTHSALQLSTKEIVAGD
jgi:autotransporter-associated beta strand protein